MRRMDDIDFNDILKFIRPDNCQGCKITTKGYCDSCVRTSFTLIDDIYNNREKEIVTEYLNSIISVEKQKNE